MVMNYLWLSCDVLLYFYFLMSVGFRNSLYIINVKVLIFVVICKIDDVFEFNEMYSIRF